MRLNILACVALVVSTPAMADGLAVSKKVTKLETNDKTITKVTVLTATPQVNACFRAPVEIDVNLDANGGKVTVATDQGDKDLASCLEVAFRKMKAKGTFTATIHLVAKPDPRKQDEKNLAMIAKLDTSKLSVSEFGAKGPSATSTGMGTGVAGDFQRGSGAADASATTSSSTVKSGAATGTLGDYTADDVTRVIKARSGTFRACYDNARRTQAKLAGTFTYSIVIDKYGAVTRATTKAKGNTNLHDCVARQFMRLKFEAKTGAKVEYPITFAPPP